MKTTRYIIPQVFSISAVDRPPMGITQPLSHWQMPSESRDTPPESPTLRTNYPLLLPHWSDFCHIPWFFSLFIQGILKRYLSRVHLQRAQEFITLDKVFPLNIRDARVFVVNKHLHGQSQSWCPLSETELGQMTSESENSYSHLLNFQGFPHGLQGNSSRKEWGCTPVIASRVFRNRSSVVS